jgi:hypothetical protein
MGKYFTVTVKPVMPVATQIQSGASDLQFGDGDVLFDWAAFDVPKGPSKLLDIGCIVRGATSGRGIQFVFAKANADNTAPSSIGTGNATASGTGYFNNIIGSITMDDTNFKTDLDYMVIGSLGHGASADQVSSAVLQGTPDSGVNVGYDRLYVAAVCTQGSHFNFSTGVLTDGAQASGLATTATTGLLVKTVDALTFFDKGDVIHVHDSDTALGTIKSVIDSTHIQLEAVSGVAAANNDEIINASPITLELSFEK